MKQAGKGKVAFGGGAVVPSLVLGISIIADLFFLMSEVQPFALILIELSGSIVVNILRLILLGL